MLPVFLNGLIIGKSTSFLIGHYDINIQGICILHHFEFFLQCVIHYTARRPAAREN